MTGAYAYTYGIWPPLVTAIVLATFGLYSWRRRSVPGALPFAISCLFWLLWLVGIVAESAATDLPAKKAWATLQAICQLPAATAITCFTLEYVQPGRWLTRRNLILLAIPSLLAAALLLTNDFHHFLWRGFVTDGFVGPENAVGGWILIGYAMSLAVVQIVALSWLFVRSPQHRWPVVLMLSGLIISRLLYVLYSGRPDPATWLDSVVLASLVPAVTYAIALFGFRIFDPLPTARQTVVLQMQTGVVVFDAGWRVVNLNPAAERIIGVRAGPTHGKTWQQLAPSGEHLPARTDVGTQRVDAATETPEMIFGSDANARYYAPTFSPLQDGRGLVVGHLLMLHDVTEQRRAHAQFLEQQRTLAVIQERERLARELHDSVGQVLAYVSMQVQAIAKRVHDGDAVMAEAQLRRLAESAQEAHVDMRESILSLKAAPAGEWFFLAVLKQYLAAYTDFSGIVTELAIQPGLGEGAFSPAAGVQLLRVIQEALTNARKHGGARCVRVALTREDGEAVVVVADDGAGFDTSGFATRALGEPLTPGDPVAREPLAAGSRNGHYGLDFMAERMAEIGGRVVVDSEPGAGTRVVLYAPVRRTGEKGA